MEVLKVILLAAGLISLAVIGLAVRVLIVKGGKFPNTHVSGNKHLKRNGICCAQAQDRLEQGKAQKKTDFKNLKIADENIKH